MSKIQAEKSPPPTHFKKNFTYLFILKTLPYAEVLCSLIIENEYLLHFTNLLNCHNPNLTSIQPQLQLGFILFYANALAWEFPKEFFEEELGSKNNIWGPLKMCEDLVIHAEQPDLKITTQNNSLR